MKKRILAVAALASFFCTIALLSGCASTSSGVSRTSKTTADLADTRLRLDKAKAQIGKTLAALDGLTSPETTDLLKQYKALCKEIKIVGSWEKKVVARGDSMRAHKDKMLKEWEEELGAFANEELRRRSEQRHAERVEMFNSLADVMANAREIYDPFYSDLKDIQRYLDIDLNPGSIQSISDLIAATNEHGKETQDWIDEVMGALRKLEQEMSPVRQK